MEIFEYLKPLSTDFEPDEQENPRLIKNRISAYLRQKPQNLPEHINLAIIGVEEDRNTIKNGGCSLAADAIRKEFYQLYHHWPHISIADFGNISKGFRVEDSYFALTEVCKKLMENKILPLIIGGTQDLSFANYKAYEQLGKVVNITSVDKCFDIGDEEEALNSGTYLSHIILHQPNYLFNYTHLGYQSYYVDKDAIKLMDNLLFDSYRLGRLRAHLQEAEPILRHTDMLSFDISAIRQSDAPANKQASPNGFTADEACQLCRYAGYSDRMSSAGFYEFNPSVADQNQTARLLAQMIWYFVDGYSNRQNEQPNFQSNEYVKFTVKVDLLDEEISFIKSKKTDRWWVRLPMGKEAPAHYEHNRMVPCSYDDYQLALKQEIPDRWMKVYQKML